MLLSLRMICICVFRKKKRRRRKMKTTRRRRDMLQQQRSLEATLSWTKQVRTNWNKDALYSVVVKR